MANLYEALTPVPTQQEVAYYLDEVYSNMSSKRRKKLDEWMSGRITLVIEGDRAIIFKHDLEHFFDTMF
jgi:hypothetical protein